MYEDPEHPAPLNEIMCTGDDEAVGAAGAAGAAITKAKAKAKMHKTDSKDMKSPAIFARAMQVCLG